MVTFTRFAPIAPAAQVSPVVPPSVPATCPAPPYCPSLPSSRTAYEAVSGSPVAWLKVGRDILLRGALVWAGVRAYDAVKGIDDPHRLSRAIAGAVGIEGFVLAYTLLKAPTPGNQP